MVRERKVYEIVSLGGGLIVKGLGMATGTAGEGMGGGQDH